MKQQQSTPQQSTAQTSEQQQTPTEDTENSWIQEGLIALGLLDGESAPEVESYGTCSDSDDGLALQIAISLCQEDSTWWQGHDFPACQQGALEDLKQLTQNTDQGPLPQGAVALVQFDAILSELESSAAAVDPDWVQSNYRPAVAEKRRRYLVEAAIDQVDSGEAVGPENSSKALLAGIDELQGLLDQIEHLSALKAGALAAKGYKVLKDETFKLPSPSTGATSSVGYPDIAVWFTHAKRFIEFSGNVDKIEDGLFGGPVEGDTLTRAAEIAKRVEMVGTGLSDTISVAALVAGGMLKATGGSNELVGRILSVSDAAKSSGVSGLLSGVSALHSVLVIYDNDSSDEEKLDAAVSFTASSASFVAKRLGAAAGGSVFAAAAVAIPATWWVFKETFMGMGEARIGGTAKMMIGEVDQYIEHAHRITELSNKVGAAMSMSEGNEGMEGAAGSFTADVRRAASELKSISTGWRSKELKTSYIGLLGHHQSIDKPEHGCAFARDLGIEVTDLLEAMPDVVAREAGLL